MRDAIRALERLSRLLEPDAAARDTLATQVVDYATDFLNRLTDDPAYVAPVDQAAFNPKAAITESGLPLETVLNLLHTHVDTISINPASGRFLGYIPGGGVFFAALGDYLAAITNRYAGVYFAGPGAVQIEGRLIDWLAHEIGYPATASGNLSSGGSIANLTAIVTAREAHHISGATIPRSVIYVTEHVHHCIDKAIRIAGLDQAIKRIVPVDAAYRMSAAALERQISEDRRAGLNPWLVIASAGTTNTGSIDPLLEVGQLAAAHGCWFHVDGAYGGLFVLCPEGRPLLQGIADSHSVVVDPHKTLFLPYGTGAVLVRDRQQQFAAFNAHADYMTNILDEDGELSPADVSPELTKHFRGLRLWLPLKVLGVAPFRAALSEKLHLARYFHAELGRVPGFEVGPAPDLSVVTYRYLPKRGDPNAFNQQLMKSILQEGRLFISSTLIERRVTLRAAIVSFRTHLDEVDEALAVLKRHAAKLES